MSRNQSWLFRKEIGMDWNRWLLRLALMSLFAVFVSACTELTPSGSSEYIIQAPGSTCLPGDVGAHNPCAAPAGCTVTEQYCDPLNGNTWTQCGTYDGCALGSPSSTMADGGSCTDGAYVFCSVGGSGGPLGIMTCSGGVYGPCGMLGSGFDAGVMPMDGSVSCGGDPLIGTACSAGLGECAATGVYVCNATGMRECNAATGTPASETCDNLDNDCDGSVDETVTRSCYTGPAGTATVGECRYGNQVCTAGSWSTTCSGEVLPATDVPDNGLDEDCNGADMGLVECGSDTRVGRGCTVGIGECVASGVFTCDTPTGTIGCSAVPGVAMTELCDDLDNDCDGTIDDGVVRSCYTGPPGTDGIGICHRGTEVCMVGVGAPPWSSCMGEQTPLTEIPDNGIDEDCSGSDLESVGCGGDMTVGTPCVTGLGACRATGALVCVGGLLRCDAVPLPPVSETCNGIDDDCDGFADDSVVRSCYTGPAGTAGVGECMPGTQVCLAGSFGACTGEVLPATDVPGNGLDEDCSGGDLTVGPCGGDPSIGTSCSVGLGACMSSGTVRCLGSTLDCSATPGTPAASDTCNGVDDDCNGVVDNGANVTCYTGPAGTAGVGVCRAGLQICSGGVLGATCSGQVLPSTEVCGNAFDEDCNGTANPCPPPPPVDAGVDSGLPMMSDAGSDAGMMSSDAGSDGGTGGSTPESVQRNLCRDARPSTLTGTITLAYDQACLNALMGTCASGWVTIFYDQNGCEVPSDPGAASLTIDRLHRLGGQYNAGLRCGTTYRPWPADARNDVVNTACVTSILFNGDQLADAESRICPAIGDGVSLVPTIPGHPSVTVSCP
ncbi:hypothetical protein IT407_04770 [Candidatus Uhrbacteria bacterium]|nr:hypothetical protein [Candidatus Uhrbacteria bacterium]